MMRLRLQLVIVDMLCVRDRREEDGISVATLHTIGPHPKLRENPKMQVNATKSFDDTTLP